MAVPMPVFVFCYVFLLRLFNKTSSFLTSRIPAGVYQESLKEKEIKQQIANLKADQLSVRAQDEFAKYARFQRRINKVSQESSELVKERNNKMTKMAMVLKVVFAILMVLCHVCFLVMNRKTPVALLPPGWLSPLQSVLAFPTGVPGAIGLPCWVISCNKMLSTVF